MSNASDFVIEDGILTKYVGSNVNVEIPEGISVIGQEAFRRKGIVSVTMPDTVTEIGFGAFSSCANLKEVLFSRNLKIVGINAFMNCPSLEYVTLHTGLEQIGACAFSGCRKLKTIAIPNGSIDIGVAAFDACPSLADEEGFVVVQNILYKYLCKYPDRMYIPEGVRHISYTTSADLYDIHRLSLPSSIESIDEKTFIGLKDLTHCELNFAVTDNKQAQWLVKRVFSWEGIAKAYLLGNLTANTLIVDAVKKQIASKTARIMLLKWACGQEDPLPIRRLLECVKKLPPEELEEAVNMASYPQVRTALMEYK